MDIEVKVGTKVVKWWQTSNAFLLYNLGFTQNRMIQYILLFTALLLCPIIDGLINNNNAIPIARSSTLPWVGLEGTKFPLFNAPELAEDAPNRSSDGPAETSTAAPHGVWVPPSQNIKQRRGRIFRIEKPQDLLDFVIEDERLSVGKQCICIL